jgi:hypothetical protein
MLILCSATKTRMLKLHFKTITKLVFDVRATQINEESEKKLLKAELDEDADKTERPTYEQSSLYLKRYFRQSHGREQKSFVLLWFFLFIILLITAKGGTEVCESLNKEGANVRCLYLL